MPALSGEILGRGLAARGHRVRAPWTGGGKGTGEADAADVVIVGGGVAGLSAAWRLARAGFEGDVVLLELGDALGGTSAVGPVHGGGGPHPLGAHYVTLPNQAARHLRVLLEELKVIRWYQNGKPHYDETALCFAPQERLYAAGAWSPGLWPDALATPADDAQWTSFEAVTAAWRVRRGADGRRAFEIPVHHSSRDPAITSLKDVSFAAWIAEQGWDSEPLRWLLEYGCLDDYGTTLEQTSAWAGLHYHCSRVPDVANDRDLGTRVLTWPEGNGRLVHALASAARADVRLRCVVRRVEEGRVHYEQEGAERTVRGRHVVLAVPTFVAARLLDRDLGPAPTFAPWRVASLHVDRLPASRGVAAAWDSVVYGGASLGYVASSHQRGDYGRGPAVLSWYQPLTDGDARSLLDATWADEADLVLRDLAPVHADLRARVHRLDVMHWGHGTARPLVGLDPLAPPPALDGVSLAHTDRSGLSLFEEASWHGVRAAEEAMTALGHDFGGTWT